MHYCHVTRGGQISLQIGSSVATTFNSLAAGLWYIRTSISAYKTAVFGCLTNALAPPPIVQRAVQRLKRIGQSSRLHSKKIFLVRGYRLFVTDVISEVVLGSFCLMLSGLEPNH